MNPGYEGRSIGLSPTFSSFFTAITEVRSGASGVLTPTTDAYSLIHSGNEVGSEVDLFDNAAYASAPSGHASILPVANKQGASWVDLFHIWTGNTNPTTALKVRVYALIPCPRGGTAPVGTPEQPNFLLPSQVSGGATHFPDWPDHLILPCATTASGVPAAADYEAEFPTASQVIRETASTAAQRFRMSGRVSFYVGGAPWIIVVPSQLSNGSTSASAYANSSEAAMVIGRFSSSV